MFYKMVSVSYVSALLLTSFHVADCLHYYKTPALDNQFSNFEITTVIPSDGANGTGEQQDALNLNLKRTFWPSTRRYFTFNFKGEGNAQLLILNSDKTKQFKVEIGGGTNHNQINVLDNKNNSFSTTINNITSEKEYRSFWIRGRWSLGYDRYAVRVGLGSDPRENELLRTQGISKSKMNMAIIRLSTSSNNSGEWQFASAGRKLGGCGDDIPCTDDGIQCCTGYHTCGKCHPCIMRMIGTCIPLCGFFPGLVFGDGNFPIEPAMTAMRMNTTLIACKTNSTTLTSNQVTTLRTLTSSTSMPITKFTSIISTKNKTFFPSKKITPNSITTTIIEPYTNQLTMIPTPTNYTLGENSPLSARSTTMSTTSRTMATIAQNIITTPNATLENTTSTLNIIRATTSFNHTLHSNALTMSGSELPNSSSIKFTTLTPTTLTQATKLTSNITSPYTTSTIATPIPSTISTSITKSLPTISVPITYTQTTKPTSTTINPSGSLFFTTTTMSSPYPALAPTTSPTTTTITQVTIPVPITFAKILTTTKSTTSKHVHTTTTVPTTYMPTTILTAPLQATELYTCKSSMPSGCLVVTTDKTFQSPRSLSFFFKNSGAILAGTVGGLVFIGAATWICFSHAAQYKRGLLLSRRVSPARTQNPDNDIENNIIDV